MAATLCPKCGLSDRVEKVRVAHDTGTEIMCSRLKAPQEPQLADFESHAMQLQPRQPEKEILLERHIPAFELFFKGHPNNLFGVIIIYGVLLPLSIIIALLPLMDVFLFPIIALSVMTSSTKIEIYLAIGGWSTLGLITDIIFVRSWRRRRKIEQQIRDRNIQILEENKLIKEANAHIYQENTRRKREKERLYKVAHDRWYAQQKIWEENLYYCYRDDRVFLSGVPQKPAVSPEKMESLFE